MVLSNSDSSQEKPSPARAGRHRRHADQGNWKEGAAPARGGRHRRVTPWSRLTGDQVSDLLAFARPLCRAVGELGKQEAPIREMVHSLTGAVQQVLDAVSTLLG